MSTESEKHFEELQQQVFPLVDGMTAEQMQSIFFDENALVEQPEPIYRINGKGNRYYYKFDAEQNPEFFVSVTTLIKQTMPTSPHLVKWIAEMGLDESSNYTQERADYGTFMHMEIATLLITRKYDTTKTKERLKAFIEENKLPSDFINHEEEIKKDLMAFAQFMIDHKVKPLAIEIVLNHKTDGYAGAIDLVCQMEIEVKGFFGEVYKSGPRKGEPKESKKWITVIAIVDFKSGRKGFYESHEVQLQGYREMWDCWFPNKPVDRLFNWSPKDWRGKKPTYNLKDQTDSKSRNKLPYLVELARIENNSANRSVTMIDGVIDIDKGIDSNLTEMTLSELVKKKQINKERK